MDKEEWPKNLNSVSPTLLHPQAEIYIDELKHNFTKNALTIRFTVALNLLDGSRTRVVATSRKSLVQEVKLPDGLMRSG
jgi:hypothetical protein